MRASPPSSTLFLLFLFSLLLLLPLFRAQDGQHHQYRIHKRISESGGTGTWFVLRSRQPTCDCCQCNGRCMKLLLQEWVLRRENHCRYILASYKHMTSCQKACRCPETSLTKLPRVGGEGGREQGEGFTRSWLRWSSSGHAANKDFSQ